MVMMKRFLALLAGFLLLGVSCNKVDDAPLNIIGDWELSSVEFATRSAMVGNETVTIYLRFSQNGSFAMWQQKGSGRFQKYEGMWVLSGNVLSGIYSDGKEWSSEYLVETKDGHLTMHTYPDKKDTYIYETSTITDNKIKL